MICSSMCPSRIVISVIPQEDSFDLFMILNRITIVAINRLVFIKDPKQGEGQIQMYIFVFNSFLV